MKKPRTLARTLEIALLVVGVLLVGIYAAATVYRWVGGRKAVQDFDAAKAEAKVTPPEPVLRPLSPVPTNVDVSLWSEKRVREYKDTLKQSFNGPIAVLDVPKFKIRVAVLEGTDEFALNRGVGWIEGTPRPGQPGNIGIAGHRDGFFRPLKDIKEGDEIDLETPTGLTTYKVDQIEIVTPDDVHVLQPRRSDSLTLVTCYPFYFIGDAPRRFIVHAARQDDASASARR
jgi:sortase A